MFLLLLEPQIACNILELMLDEDDEITEVRILKFRKYFTVLKLQAV